MQTIKLMETSGDIQAPYVALSHCWGPSDVVPKTTKENFNSHLQGIQLTNLPASFQDAISITRGLGIQFLWIDSLCIIQGDRLDWETESSKMAGIYSKCTICIAVDGSADARGGCFFNRWARELNSKTSMTPLEITIPDKTIKDKIFVQILPQSLHDLLYYGRSGLSMEKSNRLAPLQQRAWSLQERYYLLESFISTMKN